MAENEQGTGREEESLVLAVCYIPPESSSR